MRRTLAETGGNNDKNCIILVFLTDATVLGWSTFFFWPIIVDIQLHGDRRISVVQMVSRWEKNFEKKERETY